MDKLPQKFKEIDKRETPIEIQMGDYLLEMGVSSIDQLKKIMDDTHIRDLRKQKVTIKINISQEGYAIYLDNYVDDILSDIKTILEQRSLPSGISVSITINNE